jgi:hypothetical protein
VARVGEKVRRRDKRRTLMRFVRGIVVVVVLWCCGVVFCCRWIRLLGFDFAGLES